MKLFILLLMVFMHITDDYYLQGILASLKQKSWWDKNTSNKKYKNDYLMALFMHSFSWTFMIMLPIFYLNNFDVTQTMLITFIVNQAIHFTADNLKANKGMTNLVQDQSLHLLQVLVTWLIFV